MIYIIIFCYFALETFSQATMCIKRGIIFYYLYTLFINSSVLQLDKHVYLPKIFALP